ncbi:MAG TPA: hypothetical protein VFD64_02900, partial [Gemmatimonadaceae bacterium]|nr:hypothetical protein [Gemmatimonadaceae bacterium]
MRRILLLLPTLTACTAPLKLAKDDSPVVLSRHLITAQDPTVRGAHPVRRLFYGSGTDKNRVEYRDSVTIKTASVDGSKLADVPGQAGKDRTKYWGFGFNKMPV